MGHWVEGAKAEALRDQEKVRRENSRRLRGCRLSVWRGTRHHCRRTRLCCWRISNGCVQVGDGIVEQPKGFVVGFIGDLGLGGSDGTKGEEHVDVDGNHIVEESTSDLLDNADNIWQ